VTDQTEVYNRAAEMQKGADRRIDVTVRGFQLLLDITMERLREGVKVRWLMHEGFLEKARSILRAAEQRPETRSASSFPVNIVLTEKMACVEFVPSRSGASTWALFGKDPSFVRWTSDLFTHEWEKAKIWYP
jgi:predicted transcriptional regulator